MPWGWECRERLVRQKILNPTVRKNAISQEASMPGPDHYETPELYCGPGYSHIKRMPAYTFGYNTKLIVKPPYRPNAIMLDVRGIGPKGPFRIPGSIISPQIEPPSPKTKVPGPGTYVPRGDSRYKRTPAYTAMPKARPPYQPWDQWTPPPNLYLPPIPEKKAPKYSFSNNYRPIPVPDIPGPGSHEPNYKYVKPTKPSFSFGAPRKPLQPPLVPPPNTYCEKKFNAVKPSIRASSFGIRHTPYLGKQDVYLKSSKQDLQIS
ncbi:unnamed protein product [Arctia plantaginis]|uniref:Uncharacterized protein n=1 Tax=Arctia plantaginis TaxID=874455 RepID=A0A8S1A909_ARCPL|nr:unnamed protein product [Arctia plantaginis]